MFHLDKPQKKLNFRKEKFTQLNDTLNLSDMLKSSTIIYIVKRLELKVLTLLKVMREEL